jgi:hypothetical protein
VPDGGVPEGAVPFICPPISPLGGVPEGVVPSICPPGVPDGAVLFVCAPACGVPMGVALCCVSVDDVVADETALPVEGVDVLVVLVHPAIMIPAMRIADAINMTIMLFFME